jgi:hypothetical protein
MISVFIVSLCTLSADNEISPPVATNSKIDVRRAFQWIFGKRQASKDQAEQIPSATEKQTDLSDSRTEMRCRTNVFNDPTLRASGMTVRVVDGVAYLEGSAQSRFDRLRAEQLAQKTQGVLRVENHLRVAKGGDLPQALETNPSTGASGVVSPVTPGLETVSVTKHTSTAVVASRPKSLPSKDGEPAVTTYSIRRGRTSNSPLENAHVQPKQTAKEVTGKLVPWSEASISSPSEAVVDSRRNNSDLEAVATSVRLAESSLSPLDSAVRRVLASSPNSNDLTFHRKGGDVVISGSAPATAKLKVAQEIGRIEGVRTVSIDASSVGGKSTQIPSTSAIE